MAFQSWNEYFAKMELRHIKFFNIFKNKNVPICRKTSQLFQECICFSINLFYWTFTFFSICINFFNNLAKNLCFTYIGNTLFQSLVHPNFIYSVFICIPFIYFYFMTVQFSNILIYTLYSVYCLSKSYPVHIGIIKFIS